MSIKNKFLAICCIGIFLINCFSIDAAFSQESSIASKQDATATKAATSLPEPVPPADEANSLQPGNITLDFKDADINTVMRILSLKGDMNIITGKDVKGLVTMRLVDVPWEKALDVILSTYDFGYEKKGNIISVTTLEKLTAQKEAELKLATIQPLLSEVFTLKYIDANDVIRAVQPLLTKDRGKAAILETSGQRGWEFLTESKETGKRKRTAESEQKKSRTIIVSDIPQVIDKVKELIAKLDKMPMQVLIETRILEVNRNKLKDLGLEYGTGSNANTAITINRSKIRSGAEGGITERRIEEQLTGQSKTLAVSPSNFLPQAAALSGVSPFNGGLTVTLQRLLTNQFEVVLHALEEDVDTNILSAPRILALNNQEASILVGTKFPILTSNISTDTGRLVGVSLDYYQDIGIQLNVVPQIGGDDTINMIIHPAVSTSPRSITAKDSFGNTLAEYPVINTREAETQIVMKNGETIMIGGLLKDQKSESVIGVPFLSKIPILGLAFQRKTNLGEKIDLLIFITAHILKPGQLSEAQLALLKEELKAEQDKMIARQKRRFKK